MAEKTAQDIQLYDGSTWKSLNGQKVYDGTDWKEFRGIYDGADWWTLGDTIWQWSGEVNTLKTFNGFNITIKQGHYLTVDMTYQWTSDLGNNNFPITINSDNNAISCSINDSLEYSKSIFAQNWATKSQIKLPDPPQINKTYRIQLHIDTNGNITYNKDGRVLTGLSYTSGFAGVTLSTIYLGGPILSYFHPLIVFNLTVKYK